MDRIIIAQRLTALRGSRKRSEVAGKVGISVSALAMYESGQRIPRDEIKVSLAHYYKKSVEDLFFTHEPHGTCGSAHIN